MSIIDILSAPPGGLIYHLITLFAILAVLGMALDEWLRHRQPEYRRLVFAFGLLFLTRLLLVMVALVTWRGFLLSQGVLPPLERFLDLVSLLLILYTVSPRQDRAASINRLFCLINLILASIVYGVFAPLWYSSLSRFPSSHYNGSWQAWVWAIWQILVLIWALFIVTRYEVRQRPLIVSIFSILLFGHVMQLVMPQTVPHVAGWERLANLIVYPLFAVVTYRSIVEELASRTLETSEEATVQEVVHPGEEQNEFAFETDRYVFDPLGMPLLLQGITQSVMEALEVELVSVIARQVASSQDFEVAAVRHSDGLYEVDKGQVDLLNLSILRRVLQSQDHVLVEAGSDDSREWQEFLEQIGASPDQSLMVEPLVMEETTVGLLVIGDSSLQQVLSMERSQLSHSLAKIVASAVGNALLHQMIVTQPNDLDKQLQELALNEADVAIAGEAAYATEGDADLLELVGHLREELSHTQLELGQARRELLEEAGPLDLELIGRLETELDRAHRDLEQARKELEEHSAGTNMEFAERLQTEFDQMRTGEQGQADRPDTDFVEHVQNEREPAQVELRRISKEEYERAHEPDAELIEHLHSELTQARLDVEQLREDMRQAQETIQSQAGELIRRVHHVDPLFEVFQSQRREARLGPSVMHQDVRMSLNLVGGYTDLLACESVGVLAESQIRLLQRIKSSIERMRNGLGNLDILAEIESGELRLDRADVNVHLMIDNAIMQFQAQLEEKQVELVVDIPSNLPPVRADAPKLEQIVCNLLNNALKCSRPSSEVKVSVRMHSVDDKKHHVKAPFLAVSFRNAGGWIRSEEPPQVLDRSSERIHHATGGLGEKATAVAVAKRLVEAHRGHIWFEGGVGDGTSSTFTLPAKATALSDASKLTHEEARSP